MPSMNSKKRFWRSLNELAETEEFGEMLTREFPAGSDEDTIMEAAIDAGAEDVIVDDDQSIEVLTDPGEFEEVRDKIVAAGLEPENASLTMRASTSAELDAKSAASMMKILEMLDDLDDVQEVYSNADISEEILEQL